MNQTRWFSSLVWIVFENHGYDQVADLPSHKRLAANGAVLTNYLATTHPSGPNYRAMAAGDFWTNDEVYGQRQPTIGTAFPTTHVVNWRGEPAARHQPFSDCQASFDLVAGSMFDMQLSRPVVDWLPAERNDLWYVGLDDQNNAHSATLDVADANLTALLDALDESPWFRTLDPETGKYPALFLVWDEVYTDPANRVFAAWYGKGVHAGGFDAVARSHYSFCRTVTDNFGLDPLAHAAGVQPIDGIWAVNG